MKCEEPYSMKEDSFTPIPACDCINPDKHLILEKHTIPGGGIFGLWDRDEFYWKEEE